MDKIRHFIVYLVVVLPINQTWTQNTDDVYYAGYHDTISLEEYSLVIDIPIISLTHKSIFQYEEGFFITYPYIDSAYLFIHKGHNVTRPFCDSTQIKLTLENDTLKYYYGVIGGLYIKEIFYKEEKITISYINVKGEDLPLFNGIISSLKFIP